MSFRVGKIHVRGAAWIVVEVGGETKVPRIFVLLGARPSLVTQLVD